MDKPEKVHILAVSASPVADGHTENILSLFAERAFALDAEVEIIRLYEHPPTRVSGKLEGWEPDAFWGPKLRECDGLVVATPVYWFGPPGILKDWIDNLTPLTYKFELDGKVAGFIVYGPEGGASSLTQYLSLVANNIGLLIPPYGLIWQEGPQKTGINAWVSHAAPALAQNMISLIVALMEMTTNEETSSGFMRERIKRFRAKGRKIPILPVEPEETTDLLPEPSPPEPAP